MLIVLWAIAVLLYFLCGMIYCVAYIWNYRTTPASAKLGLMGLFWLVLLLFDFFLSIASAFGGATKRIAMKGMEGRE